MARYDGFLTKINVMLAKLPKLSKRLHDLAEIRRVETLYSRLPSATISVLIGILITFAVLFESTSADLLKAWAAFMLSGLGMRVWLWFTFRGAEKTIDSIGRWEWLFVGGVFITSAGWAALSGPLFPAHPYQQILILVMLLMVSAFGVTLLSTSNIAIWTFLSITLFPIIWRFITLQNGYLPVIAGIGCLLAMAITQRSLYRFAVENLQRSAEAESLVAEQDAIFQSSPMGIAVIQGQELIKCNVRLGELLGHSLADMTTIPFHSHFVNDDEVEQFLADADAAFAKEYAAQGIYRLRRADKSQFWAEIFGRRMPANTGQTGNTVWMIADVTMRVARQSPAR